VLKAWSPADGANLGVDRNIRMWDLAGSNRSLGCTLGGALSLALSASWPPGGEHPCSNTLLHHDILLHLEPKAMGPADFELKLKPLKP
jgi:hypothetical protein